MMQRTINAITFTNKYGHVSISLPSETESEELSEEPTQLGTAGLSPH